MSRNQRSVNPVNVKEIVGYLLGYIPRGMTLDAFLSWPPDVFAVSCYLLRESGAYIEVVKKWVDANPPTAKDWAHAIEQDSLYWLLAADGGKPSPVIRALWNQIMRHGAVQLTEIASTPSLWRALLRLVALADEASAGFGLPPNLSTQQINSLYKLRKRKLSKKQPTIEQINEQLRIASSNMSSKALIQLFPSKCPSSPASCTTFARCKELNACHAPSTLCKFVHPSKVVVLPKMHTPQSGITIRSLTHHLALVCGSHVIPKWVNCEIRDPNRGENARQPGPMNLLLIPWPLETFPSQFRPVESRNQQLLANDHSFFCYRPVPAPSDLEGKIQELCRQATKKVGPVDGIVLPEMALTPGELELLSGKILGDAGFIVSGVCDDKNNGEPARNYAEFRYRVGNQFHYSRLMQQKHHRWFLERHQIAQYGLGSSLHPDTKWWEHTTLESRMIHFITINRWLTMSVLICEDLARPDPTADIVRAVGPNLVITLLQDGPQLASRWAARYATVLADDPGSAVLTLTSAGMCKLSRPFGGVARSRVVALWRDKDSGTREIELPDNCHSVLLSLTNSLQREWTADGRDDAGQSGCLRLSGIYPLKWD